MLAMYETIVGVATVVSALASVIAAGHQLVGAVRKQREKKRRQNDQQVKS